MPQPIARWNPARDVWEIPQTEGLLCEHLDVFWETFPTSGMTVAGTAYELPTSVAPHGRFRVFVVAQSAANPLRPRAAASIGHDPACGHSGPVDVADGLTLLATPQSRDYKGVPGDGFNTANLCRDVSLLPTPAVNDMGEGKTPEAWDEWTAKMQAAHGNGNGHGKSLAIEAQRLEPKLLPTIKATNNENRPSPGFDNGGEVFYHILRDDRWGEYADAIARWEALTRPAPPPTQPSKKGTPQLSPAFSEWLMGLPAGHVTDVPGLSRNDQLKALGNGVVPQQAEVALRFLLSVKEVAA